MVRSVDLLELRRTLRVERLLIECLLRLTDVVQEVDIALVERLRRLAKSALLDAELTQLATKCTQTLRDVLADAKLLTSQRANALANVLERTGLLAVDAGSGLRDVGTLPSLRCQEVGDVLLNVRLLPSERPGLRSKVAVTLCSLLIKACCRLTELRLLHAKLTKPLPSSDLVLCEVAVKAGRCLSQLRLLRGLLTDRLARLHRALLLLLKGRHRIGLRLRVTLIEKIGDRARLLIHQAPLELGTLHAFALATKCTGANRLRSKALPSNRALAIDLTHRLVNHLLLIRVHEGLGCGTRLEATNASAQKTLRTCEVRTRSAKRQLLRTSEAREPLSDRRGRRTYVRLRGQSGHVLSRGQRTEARLYVLISTAQAARDIRLHGTLASKIQIAKARSELAYARGNARACQCSVLHGHLGVSELTTRIGTAQIIGGFGSRLKARTNGLIRRLYIRHVAAHALRLSSAHRSKLCGREACDLIARQLL